MKNFRNKISKKGRGQVLYKRAKKIIPGGTQLLSKRPEMFVPEFWPAYYSKAKGCKVWDLNENQFIDMSIMGIGANILGYADDDVDNAVKEVIGNGVSSTLNCPEEVELAELLIKIHPWADMVRFARSGGEACALAIRVARASTNRDKVLFSGYHGWHDWYLAANISDSKGLDGQLIPGLEPNGVPRYLKGTSIPFHFNNIDELKKKAAGIESQIAAIIVEPARGEDAPKDYLAALKEFSKYIGAVLIFDEITSGFRMCPGGLHLKYGINPDLAIFAKSIANGYAMSAVIGIEKHMSVSQATFMSSTNWTERIGPTAAIATIKKYKKESVHKHIINVGEKFKGLIDQKSAKFGLDISISGLPSLCSFSLDNPNSKKIMTFFTFQMLKLGFLGYRQFKPSFAHSLYHIDNYAKALDEIFEMIASEKWRELNELENAHSSFKRLTSE